MDTVISAIKKPGRWILVGCFGAIALFESLFAIGYSTAFNNGGRTIACLLQALVYLLICGTMIFALIGKKSDAAKRLGVLIVGFSIIAGMITIGTGFSTDAAGILNFIGSVFLIGTGGIYLAKLLFPKLNANKILGIVALGCLATYCLLHLIALFISFGGVGEYGDYAWVFVMRLLAEIAMVPAILIGYLFLAVNEGDFKFEKKPAPAPAAEELVKEEPAPEEPAPEEEPEAKPEEEPAPEEPKPEE